MKKEANETIKLSEQTIKKEIQDTIEFCVYIGPSIQGVIQSGTIYPGTMTQTNSELSAVLQRYPLISHLIVSGETLPEDRIKVKTVGNLLNANYKKLVSVNKK